MTMHQVVSKDEWLAARKRLLAKEKEFTRMRDQLSAERRSLPWVRIEKEYAFEASGGRLVPVPGGVLVRDTDGALLGAVGISGDTSDNDEAAALAGIAAAGLEAETGA